MVVRTGMSTQATLGPLVSSQCELQGQNQRLIYIARVARMSKCRRRRSERLVAHALREREILDRYQASALRSGPPRLHGFQWHLNSELRQWARTARQNECNGRVGRGPPFKHLLLQSGHAKRWTLSVSRDTVVDAGGHGGIRNHVMSWRKQNGRVEIAHGSFCFGPLAVAVFYPDGTRRLVFFSIHDEARTSGIFLGQQCAPRCLVGRMDHFGHVRLQTNGSQTRSRYTLRQLISHCTFFRCVHDCVHRCGKHVAGHTCLAIYPHF